MASQSFILLTSISLLAACNSSPGSSNGTSASRSVNGDGEDLIACATGGAEKFTNECVVERSEDQGKLFLIVRHPDGGFRRFEVMTDGTGLATADGAQDARVAVADGLLDVSVGVDRYRFPATVKAGAEAAVGQGTEPKGDATAGQ